MAGHGLRCVALREIPPSQLHFPNRQSRIVWEKQNFDSIEVGRTMQQNAELKANCLWHMLRRPCIAEDSGLTVEALRGQPGVRSARYGSRRWLWPRTLSDAQQCELILRQLSHLPQQVQLRRARFICVLAYRSAVRTAFFFGSCEGFIGDQSRGKHGFGYDPIFHPLPIANLATDSRVGMCNRLDRQLRKNKPTMAELTPKQKNLISHRGQALQQMLRALN